MEHYRSTLTTAAALVLGLVSASHILYPHSAEDDRPRVRTTSVVNTAEATPSGWVDLPAGQAVGIKDEAEGRSHLASSVAQRPASFTLLSPDTSALLTAAAAIPSRPAAMIKRQRTARPATRVRTAAVAPAQSGESVGTNETGAQPTEAKPRVNLIGDLLKNLGIGREG